MHNNFTPTKDTLGSVGAERANYLIGKKGQAEVSFRIAPKNCHNCLSKEGGKEKYE